MLLSHEMLIFRQLLTTITRHGTYPQHKNTAQKKHRRSVLRLIFAFLLLTLCVTQAQTTQTTTLSLDGHEVEHMMVFFDTGADEVPTHLFETYHEVLHQLEGICTEEHDRIAAEVMQVAANPKMMMNHLEVMQELRATLPNIRDSSARCTEKLTLVVQVCQGRTRCFHLPLDNTRD